MNLVTSILIDLRATIDGIYLEQLVGRIMQGLENERTAEPERQLTDEGWDVA